MGVADQIVRMAVAAVRFPISLVSLQAGPAPGAIFYLPNSFPKAISGKISGPSSDISTCFRLIEEAVGSAIPQVAKACGVLAKNDRLDARMIALFVATLPTRSAQRYAAVERLAELVTARRQLSDDKVAAENASRLFEDAASRS